MSRKVVIVGPDTGGIPQSVAKAFGRLGWLAETCLYLPPVITSVGKLLLHRLRDPHSDRAFRREFNRAIRERLLQVVAERGADLILILKGDYLDECHVGLLQSCRIPLVLWTLDSLSRAPAQKILAQMALHTFYIDGGDLTPGAAAASWLPLGFDADLYRPQPASAKDTDVLLIGSLGARYRRRSAALKRLHASPLSRDWSCGFIGSSGTIAGNLAMTLRHRSRRPGGVSWLSRRVPAGQLAGAIARSRICVNIHQDDGLMPVNPMFFAIPGCGTCQLAEESPHLARWLRPGVDYAACSEASLLAQLQGLLESPELLERIGRAGYLASSRHSYEARVAAILAQIGAA